MSISGRVDVALFIGYGPWDLPLLERVGAGRHSAKATALWLPEVWPSQLSDKRIRYEGYSMIDHIFVGEPEAIDPIRSIAPNSDVHHLPLATDVMRFGARPDDPRPIGILGIGRRMPTQHRELLAWSDANSKLYLYDTLAGKACEWAEHRNAVAAWYRMADIAVVNYSKHDQPTVVGDLRALPGRLFEGLAAGCVLVGRAPDEQRQRLVVGEVVVRDVGAGNMLDCLPAEGDRDTVWDERCRNLALALRRHDWSHRWATLFEQIGQPCPSVLEERIEMLAKRGDKVAALRRGSPPPV